MPRTSTQCHERCRSKGIGMPRLKHVRGLRLAGVPSGKRLAVKERHCDRGGRLKSFGVMAPGAERGIRRGVSVLSAERGKFNTFRKEASAKPPARPCRTRTDAPMVFGRTVESECIFMLRSAVRKRRRTKLAAGHASRDASGILRT